jgi:hypothetical protein
MRQMIDVFDELDGPVLAVERVPKDDVSAYGIIEAEEIRDGVYRIRDMVEKPPRDEAPSDLAIIGRYILTPDIFPALEATASDRTGEIQLTNGLRRLLKDRPIYGCRIDGVRHDTGNKLGFLKAVVYFALRRPDLAEPFREYLKSAQADHALGQPLSLRVSIPQPCRRRRLEAPPPPAESLFAASLFAASALRRVPLRRLAPPTFGFEPAPVVPSTAVFFA